MSILTDRFNVETNGFTDIINITAQVQQIVSKYKLEQAQLLVYVAGSTAAITTMEYEPGLIQDLPECLDKLIPQDKVYNHDKKWNDGNGYSHIRASIIGSSQTFPIMNNEIMLGTWQQIVLLDFDNKPRTRSIILQLTY